ncbi:hypothetical protein CAOG_05287 [Capsaspora owczarzaki ATCC 30864]|uniref:Elongin-C n=1 Tax=Capsaspora owczarzaki (strain ATCC 30864) TaxID=595528 RepID=A0A0D2WRS1_CAPO3|nr:hypothetical protein CAOG_05287 [Capsaspora owczarzaki ATCC 30864]KJE94675.1 hypothetical protein CAOG_005287 [Capsaspora owczarzaki ATCC 30864]|eukprot:XP_004346972.1 hypothetical protein CAOG_05287 [Capsaspora owczarzaki ATCC 30864]
MVDTDEEYVKIISADNFVFIVSKRCATVSNTIKSMLSGNFVEKKNNEVHCREIPSGILEKVCKYFYYKVRHTNSTSETPEFDIEPEIAIELLMAANFLDV